MKFILLIKDLVSRTHVKSLLAEGADIIGPRNFDLNCLPAAKDCRIFLDLESGSEFIPVIATLSDDYKAESLHCFFPHVKKELFDIAVAAGFKNILPRSRFFASISEMQ